MSCQEYLNRKTLIVGDVRSGKTERTLKILRDLMNCATGPIAILDLAPEKVQGVGGKIPLSLKEKKQVFYFSPRIVPPRLTGKTEEEIRELARGNYERIKESLRALKEKDPACLVINDVSLYLHEGSAEKLISYIEIIPTLLMNGYYGRFFGDSAFSRREREQMEILIGCCHQVFYLPPIET